MDKINWKKISKIDDKNNKEKAFYFSNFYIAVSVALSLCTLTFQSKVKIN